MKKDSIPLTEIVAARNALADEYLTLKEGLGKKSLINWIHKKRIEERVVQIEQQLSNLDNWLQEVLTG